MKKLLLILSLIGSVSVFTGCGGDDEKDTNPLVGTWYLSAYVSEDCDDPENDISGTATCTDSECLSFTFKEDGTFDYLIKGDGIELEISGTYTTSGSSLNLNFDGDASAVTFSLAGNKLTFEYTDDEDGCSSTETYTKQ